MRATGGKKHNIIIEKLQYMEERDKAEVGRKGDRRRNQWIISYNVRGLEKGVKLGAIRRLIKKKGADMICLQEIKKEMVDKAMCQALWGDVEVSWEMQPTNNTAGGILCLWSEKSLYKRYNINNSNVCTCVYY